MLGLAAVQWINPLLLALYRWLPPLVGEILLWVLLALLAVVTAYLVDGSFNPFLYFRF